MAAPSKPAAPEASSGQGCVALLVVAAVLFFGYRLIRDWLPPPSKFELSASQKMLQSLYGAPAYFSVVLEPRNRGVQRQELWIYPGHQAAFAFVDGELQNSYEIQSFAEQSRSLRPRDVRAMSTSQFAKVIASKPVRTQKLQDSMEWQEYADGLIAVFRNGRLAMVKAMPLVSP